ncbi:MULTISPECIES: transporter substrate-binding domain-containing protein [Paenibacillus]|uniref:ABC transporter substrate-binding protein n=1 Tax=Paenibacillus naphthalenovorans TaxID=162209 RepID=A0A0U2W798_9BACL|nr:MULTISPECIES: transporter substrate-binding domain-containing protein [Paenibacillus]ALS24420.1 ABC transporter substrate-binding protein [Paenibacillus naphthalenovorans]
MKNKKKKSLLTAVLFAPLIASIALGGCASQAVETQTGTNAEVNAKIGTAEAKKIKVAFAQTGKPITYVDENGKATGYDVEVLKLVDELLPQYEFEFVPTTDDDLLIGVESGKYDVGLKNAFYTEARAAKYIYPKEYLGASASGLLIRKEDEGTIHDLSDIAKLDKKLLPIAPQDAQYSLVQTYNNEHPEDPIPIEASESFTVQDGILLIAEGKYDAWLVIKSNYDINVVAKDGAYHNLADELAWSTFAATKTWPLFNKKQQALADAYDGAIKQLKEQGKTKELLVQFLGEDTASYLK